jgi:hypothetical protein
MTFLLANWKFVLIGLLVFTTGFCYKLWREEVRAFAVFKAQVEVLGKAAQVEKERIEREHEKVTKEIKDAIPKKIAIARGAAVANYIASLPANASCSGVSSTSDSAGGVDGSSAESIPASGAFIQDCAQDAATVGLWQSWARGMQLPVK